MRTRSFALTVALLVPACMPAGNDVVRSPVDKRLEPRYDARAAAEFKDVAAATGGDAWTLPAADATHLGPVIDTLAGSFGAVDVAFVVDTTRSMKPKLDVLGKEADGILARLWAKSAGSRVAVVSFRDAGDIYVSRVVSDFSDKKDHAAAALRGLRAEGGGDPAEHAYSGLMLAAKKLAWRPEARKVLLLVSDAPAHAGHADGDTREKFVESAKASTLSLYAVTLPEFLTDTAPGGASEGPITISVSDSKPMPGDDHGSGHDHDLTTTLDYDAAGLRDVSAMAAKAGGMTYLAPCPEELPGVLRGAMHAAVARAGGKAADVVVLLDTSTTMNIALKAARMGADSAMLDFSDKHIDATVGLSLFRAAGTAYTFKVDQALTATYDSVRDAFWKVSAEGDGPRPLAAALVEALDKNPWRPAATKFVLVVTDGNPAGGAAERDKAIDAARKKGVTVEAVFVGFGPYDGPFDESGSAGTIKGDDYDPEGGEIDDLETIVKVFPKGRVVRATGGKELEKSVKSLFDEIHKGGSPTSIEVAFVVDATGSMGSIIDDLARSHDAFHDFLEAGGRVAVVSFKDVGDDYVARRETDFVSDAHVVLKALSKISASGGGDLPEAMYYALEETSRLSWTPGSKRFVIMVTDDVSHRDEDKKEAVRSWAKAGDATLFAMDCAYEFSGDDDYDPPEPGYAPDAIAKMFKDGKHVKAETKKAFAEAIDGILEGLVKGAKKGEKIDLAIVMDTTGSMGEAARGLSGDKARYEKFVDKKAGRRIALVDFKDEGDDWLSKVTKDFTSDVADLMKGLESFEASGGGDLPEALFHGMMTATTELKWEAKAKKVIIVVTDAEAHERKKDREAVVEWATKNKAVVHVVETTWWD